LALSLRFEHGALPLERFGAIELGGLCETLDLPDVVAGLLPKVRGALRPFANERVMVFLLELRAHLRVHRVELRRLLSQRRLETLPRCFRVHVESAQVRLPFLE